MAITASTSSGTQNYNPVPQGTHVAICYGVISLGTQHKQSQLYGDSWKPQLMIRWEIPDERLDDDRPMAISRTFTLSMHENSALRPFVEGWLGKSFTDEQAAQFDFESLISKPCMLNVVHKTVGDKTYANVTSASPIPKRITPPDGSENEPIVYDISQGPPPASFPDWLKQKIMGCQEFQESKVNQSATDVDGNPAPPPNVDPNDDNPPW